MIAGVITSSGFEIELFHQLRRGLNLSMPANSYILPEWAVNLISGLISEAGRLFRYADDDNA